MSRNYVSNEKCHGNVMKCDENVTKMSRMSRSECKNTNRKNITKLCAKLKLSCFCNVFVTKCHVLKKGSTFRRVDNFFFDHPIQHVFPHMSP